MVGHRHPGDHTVPPPRALPPVLPDVAGIAAGIQPTVDATGPIPPAGEPPDTVSSHCPPPSSPTARVRCSYRRRTHPRIDDALPLVHRSFHLSERSGSSVTTGKVAGGRRTGPPVDAPCGRPTTFGYAEAGRDSMERRGVHWHCRPPGATHPPPRHTSGGTSARPMHPPRVGPSNGEPHHSHHPTHKENLDARP